MYLCMGVLVLVNHSFVPISFKERKKKANKFHDPYVSLCCLYVLCDTHPCSVVNNTRRGRTETPEESSRYL